MTRKIKRKERKERQKMLATVLGKEGSVKKGRGEKAGGEGESKMKR